MTLPATDSRSSALWRAATRYVTSDDGCWLSVYATQNRGYAQVKYRSPGDRRTLSLLAHRAAWEYHRGPVPDGLTLDHLCGVKRCVRPDHLEPVTAIENQRRAFGADLCQRGHRAWRLRPNGSRVCRTCETDGSRRRRQY